MRKQNSTRRNILKGIGTTAGVMMAFPSVSASKSNKIKKGKSQFREDIRKATKLREATGSQSKFLKYLKKKGYGVQSVTTVDSFPSEETNEGISTRKLEPNASYELRASMSLLKYWGPHDRILSDVYVEYEWEWDVDSGYGEGSRDVFGIGWDADEFKYESGGATSSSNVSHFDRTASSVAFKYDDTSLSDPDFDSGYGGSYVDPYDYSQGSRFYGRYTHTHNEFRACGYSISSGGNVIVNVCHEGKADNGGYTQIDYSEGSNVW